MRQLEKGLTARSATFSIDVHQQSHTLAHSMTARSYRFVALTMALQLTHGHRGERERGGGRRQCVCTSTRTSDRRPLVWPRHFYQCSNQFGTTVSVPTTTTNNEERDRTTRVLKRVLNCRLERERVSLHPIVSIFLSERVMSAWRTYISVCNA